MVGTLQEAPRISSPGSERLPENVPIKQAIRFEQAVSQNETANPKNDTTKNDTNKVDFSKLRDKLQEILNEDSLYIKFDKDEETDKMIFKIINFETKEVVKQIPPEISLKIARYIASKYDDVNITNFQA